MNACGLLHFDAHFENILTDGRQLFFADYGLAISSRFELAQGEADFFDQHRTYDQCYGFPRQSRQPLSVMHPSPT
ncbi:hypothetical protein ACOBQB_00960 [Streptomyces sp. G5(2025)]|uniref:hypothetical protein n=1 Tax=Streptomyces sp. G5(2025) TaxID=3406628 RepID=UPI003C1F5EC4